MLLAGIRRARRRFDAAHLTMADQKFTRCPGCGTVFRVTPAQLALREGQVRCGHCRAVFDANDHFVALGAGSRDDDPGSRTNSRWDAPP